MRVRAPARHNYVYGLTSRVDPGNTIPEANEANNSRSLNVKAVSQVDLTVDLTTKTGTPGQPGHGRRGTATGGRSTTRRTSTSWSSSRSARSRRTCPPCRRGWTCQIEENPINKVTCHGDLTEDSAVSFKVDTYVTATATTANAFIDPGNTVVENAEGNNADSIS